MLQGSGTDHDRKIAVTVDARNKYRLNSTQTGTKFRKEAQYTVQSEKKKMLVESDWKSNPGHLQAREALLIKGGV